MEQKYQDLGLVVGEKLKHLIKESKFGTQLSFANACHVDVRTVGRWINQGLDSLTTLFQIADILKVDVLTILPV